ncbi:MAG: hypothetical protein KCHDKBKB_00635 [Elusimicrobia bacterium]|nr:hypothetical protein [Elusimicrobiota bacterium]
MKKLDISNNWLGGAIVGIAIANAFIIYLLTR